MTIPRYIFREYDIRGVADTELTSPVAEAIGKAFATYLARKGIKKLTIGCDNRVSSPGLKEAVIAGVTSVGSGVIDIGTVVTPMVYFSAYHFDVNGSIQVTASHNPPEDNGIKMRENKQPLFIGGTTMLADMIESEDFDEVQNARLAEAKRAKFRVQSEDISEAYIDRITRGITLQRPLKVVVDTGNGTGGLFVRRILEKLGVEATYLFEQSDGTFPNHTPDPNHEDWYTLLEETVREQHADLGVALDGDCDRMNAIDEHGNFLGPDKLAILFAREVLSTHKGGKVVFNALMSQAIADDVRAQGGETFIGKAGYPNIAARMQEVRAVLGNEMSGHFFFADDYYGFDDAFYAMVRLLHFVSKDTKTISAILSDIPRYISTKEFRIPVEETRKFAIVEELTEDLKKDYPVDTIDGARVTFDQGWGIVRASNTQPVLSMRFEAKTEPDLEKIKSVFKEKLSQYELKLAF